MIRVWNEEIFCWIENCGTPGIILLSLFAFLFGGVFGSFMTACVWRIPRGISIVWPPSSCPKCGHRITALENIPMLSWLLLRGKCSGCGLPISPRYFWTEFATAVLFTLHALRFLLFAPHHVTGLVSGWILILLAVGATCTDLELRIIPDKFTYPAILLGLAAAWLPGAMPVRGMNGPGAFLYAFFSGLFILLFGLGVHLLGKKLFHQDAFGLGDVKYLTAAAVFLGVFGTMILLMLSCLAALVFAVFRGRKKWKKPIPFGPFLAGAAVSLLLLLPFF